MPKRRRAPGEGSLYQRPDGTWEAIITIPGPPGATQQRRSRRARTKTEAARKLEKLKAENRDGFHTPDTLTVEEHIQEWFKEHQRGWKPATIDVYRRLIKNQVTPHLGGLRFKNLNSHAIRHALAVIEEENGVSMARTTRTILHSACDWAVRMHMLPRNPVTPVRVNPATAREAVLWTPSEAATFLEHAAGHALYPFFYTLLTTGMRRGEALALRWGDLSGNRITIRQTVGRINRELVVSEPKSKKSRRVIVLPPDTMRVLEQHRARVEAALAAVGGVVGESTPVFCDELGGVRNPKRAYKDFQRLVRAAGVPVCTLHDLRHWHASSLIRAGLDPQAVAERLGHASARLTLGVYSHAFDEQRERAALTLSELGGGGE